MKLKPDLLKDKLGRTSAILGLFNRPPPGIVEGVSMSIAPVSTKLRFFLRVGSGDAWNLSWKL